jgi:hypothetical protein
MLFQRFASKIHTPNRLPMTGVRIPSSHHARDSSSGKMRAMASLIEDILTRAGGLAEGTPVSCRTFLDLGTKPAIRNALLRLLRSQKLLRVGRGIYVMPVVSRFGSSAPSAHRFIEELSKQSGEDIVSLGATTANALGLTTQVPVQMVYWTSGRSRKLNLGKLMLHLEHVAPGSLLSPRSAPERSFVLSRGQARSECIRC